MQRYITQNTPFHPQFVALALQDVAIFVLKRWAREAF
jgi:hypothetical protein